MKRKGLERTFIDNTRNAMGGEELDRKVTINENGEEGIRSEVHNPIDPCFIKFKRKNKCSHIFPAQFIKGF